MKVFIIGPGGAGKTTAGKILASLLDYQFIDLDEEFCSRIENIGEYIKSNGYVSYCYKNSELFFKILKEIEENIVFALSSGFLVHEGLDDLVKKHKKIIKKNGVSVLILPSKSKKESIQIIIKRQLNRGFGLNESREKEKINTRFDLYKESGDINIYSSKSPEEVAREMFLKLKTFHK